MIPTFRIDEIWDDVASGQSVAYIGTSKQCSMVKGALAMAGRAAETTSWSAECIVHMGGGTLRFYRRADHLMRSVSIDAVYLDTTGNLSRDYANDVVVAARAGDYAKVRRSEHRPT